MYIRERCYDTVAGFVRRVPVRLRYRSAAGRAEVISLVGHKPVAMPANPALFAEVGVNRRRAELARSVMYHLIERTIRNMLVEVAENLVLDRHEGVAGLLKLCKALVRRDLRDIAYQTDALRVIVEAESANDSPRREELCGKLVRLHFEHTILLCGQPASCESGIFEVNKMPEHDVSDFVGERPTDPLIAINALIIYDDVLAGASDGLCLSLGIVTQEAERILFTRVIAKLKPPEQMPLGKASYNLSRVYRELADIELGEEFVRPLTDICESWFSWYLCPSCGCTQGTYPPALPSCRCPDLSGQNYERDRLLFSERLPAASRF